jgi:hypothetical protein
LSVEGEGDGAVGRGSAGSAEEPSVIRSLALAYAGIWAQIGRTVNILAMEGMILDPSCADPGMVASYLHSHRHHVRNLLAGLERADLHLGSMLGLLDESSACDS